MENVEKDPDVRRMLAQVFLQGYEENREELRAESVLDMKKAYKRMLESMKPLFEGFTDEDSESIATELQKLNDFESGFEILKIALYACSIMKQTTDKVFLNLFIQLEVEQIMKTKGNA